MVSLYTEHGVGHVGIHVRARLECKHVNTHYLLLLRMLALWPPVDLCRGFVACRLIAFCITSVFVVWLHGIVCW